MPKLPMTVLFAVLATSPALAVSTAFTIDLGNADAQRQTIRYQCEDGIERVVQYVNINPNFLALVPVEDGTLIFASVISASGARYAAGQWVWWTSGPEADLYDTTNGPDAPPVTHCLELNQTP